MVARGFIGGALIGGLFASLGGIVLGLVFVLPFAAARSRAGAAIAAGDHARRRAAPLRGCDDQEVVLTPACTTDNRRRDHVATERVAIYPGSFDPPTNGHLDIVERASRLFDRVVIGVGRNLSKKTVFTADERVALMQEACTQLRNVEVLTFDSLQVEFARQVGANFIIRGIRALSDFEFEFEMANMNRLLAEELEMVFLMTAPEYLFVSASRVKELVAFGAPVDKLVPVNVAKALAKKAKHGLRTGATEPKD